MKKILIKLIAITLILSACGEKPSTESVKVERFIKSELTVEEILDLSITKKTPSFEIYAKSEAKNQAIIISQSSGIITNLNASLGQNIKVNEVLAIIGNSLSTDINNSQINSSNEALTQNEKSKNNLEKISNVSIESAKIAKDIAYETYTNAKNQLKSTQNINEIQLKSTKDANKKAKNAYYDADEALENYKNSNNDKSKLSELENQVDSLYFAYKQSKYTLEQVEESQKAQENQLKYAIEIAQNQYQLSEKQYQNAVLSIEGQKIALDSQELQLKSNKDLLEINQKYLKIRSPIKGIITEIYAKENNFIASGQSLVKIEDPNEIMLSASLNDSEIKQIKLHDTVDVFYNDKTLKGQITKISPTPNQNTKKTEIEISLNKNEEIQSGILVKVEFYSSKRENIYIPISSIFIKDEKKLVKTINTNNFIELIEIESGEIFGNLIEIKKGLKGDEKVLIKGQSFIDAGHKIVINKK